MLDLSPEAIEQVTIADLLPNLADIARDKEALEVKGQLLKECNQLLRTRLHEIATKKANEERG